MSVIALGRRIVRTDTLTAAQVFALFPHIKNPPHTYYEIQNKGRESHFPPGMPPAFYDPFVEHFEERSRTATAQAKLYARKRRELEAHAWQSIAGRWAQAARIALMRKQRELNRVTPAPEQPLERPAFEWDEP